MDQIKDILELTEHYEKIIAELKDENAELRNIAESYRAMLVKALDQVETLWSVYDTEGADTEKIETIIKEVKAVLESGEE